VTLDLRPSITGTTGDGYPDSINIYGTVGVDNINLSGAPGRVTVTGLSPTVIIQNPDYARDTLTVSSGAEADIVNAQGVSANVIRLVFQGRTRRRHTYGQPWRRCVPVVAR
jgi:hypothetical protein